MAKKEESVETKAQEPAAKFSANEFLQGTKDELGKVVWPSRQQLISESIAVILMVTLSATTIYFVDKLFAYLSGSLFGA